MNDILSVLLLLSVPGLPLLLAFPALHSRLSWSCYLALLPALILLVLPTDVSVDLPWLLFGTELGLDGTYRWLIGMSVLLWIFAASLLQPLKDPAANNRLISFFMLTLAGNLGTILATGLVGFFVFSTLMGYGFYGLLVSAGGDTARRGGRGYLVLLILADLALFEGLLIAAATTGDLAFDSVHLAMAQSDSPGLFLLMVLAGFALKAGVWPLHFWLPLVYRSSQPVVALLLPVVPITLAMLGTVRWLPLGEFSSPGLGLIIQAIGVAAMLYAILTGLKKAQLKTLPVHAIILVTGLFFTAIGVGLADHAAWNRYGNWALYFITSLGLGMAVLITVSGWLQAKQHYPAITAKQVEDFSLWFERWPGIIVAWTGKAGFVTLPRWRAWWLAKVRRLWLFICALQSMLDASERTLQRWTFAITLFLLLGIAVVFVGAPS
ncbi:MAG: proton-conducting transporter membrane subunit [Gammaproteobacteria bacterium]